MKGTKTRNSVEVFEQAVKDAEEKKYLLRLYVAGATPKSTQAIMNIKKICEEHLKDRYELEVIDIYQQPTLAKGEQIIAAPTLVKKLPPPLRRFIGSMADMERILVGLDLKPVEKTPPQDTKKGHKAP
jgi:circadian clock protein KaiB